MMNGNWQKDYPLLPESLKESDIENNSSLKKMINFIGGNKKVLDVGCATGYLARLLREKGCSVIGIEINQKAAEIARSFCEEVIAVDLERVSLAEILSDRLFDVVVFGDILEHLRDPWRILQETHQVLAPSGYVVASIPNIAHGNIRLSLLQGNFDYQEVGILDNTHLRFFTRKTLEELFFDTGYSIEATERTQMPFEKSYSHDASLVEKLEKEPDIDTLQFIVRAFPSSLENQHNLLRENYRQSIDRLERTREELESTRSQLEKTVSLFIFPLFILGNYKEINFYRLLKIYSISTTVVVLFFFFRFTIVYPEYFNKYLNGIHLWEMGYVFSIRSKLNPVDSVLMIARLFRKIQDTLESCHE